MVTKDKYWGFVKAYLYGERLSLPAKSTLASVYMRKKKNKTKLNFLWYHLYTVLHLLCHIFMFVMREHRLHQEWVTLEFYGSSGDSTCFYNINSYGRHAFSVSALLLWNSLPQHIRDAGSLDIKLYPTSLICWGSTVENWSF